MKRAKRAAIKILAVCAIGLLACVSLPAQALNGSTVQQQRTQLTAPGPGTIMGYVYWDGNAVKHAPANDCSGLSVSVSAGGSSLGTFSAGHFAYITNAATLSVCAYAIDQMPVGTNLEVQVGVTSPAAFSPSTLATGGATSINIMTGKTEFNKCNNPSPAVPSAADLARNWSTCPNYAYNVNFLLTPARGLVGANRMAVGNVPPGAPQTANPGAQGPLLSPGGQRTLLGPQGNSSTDGGRSNLPAVQQPTAGGKSAAPPSAPGDGGGKSSLPAVQRSATVDGSLNSGNKQIGSGGAVGPGQTMSAQGNAGTLPGQRPGALPAANADAARAAIAIQQNPDVFVAQACAKDPSFRVLGVSGAPDGKTLTVGPQYTIWGCSFGAAGLLKAPTPVNSPSQNRTQAQVGQPAVAIYSTPFKTAWFVYATIVSWSDNAISIQVTPSEAVYRGQSVAGMDLPAGLWVTRADGETRILWQLFFKPELSVPPGTNPNNGARPSSGSTFGPSQTMSAGGNSASSAAPTSQAARQQMKAQPAKTVVRGKVLTINGRPPAATANAATVAALQKQRQAAETLVAAHVAEGIHLQSQSGGAVGGGQARIMADGGRIAPSAGRGTMLNTAPGVVPGPSQTMGAPAPPSPGSRASSAARLQIDGTVVACTHDPTFRVLSVTGNSFSGTFTPVDPYNLYIIKGCSFGTQAPTTDQGPTDWIHLYGAGTFAGKFLIKFWSDNEIDAALDPALTGSPDLANLNLVIKRADGQEAQKGGFQFSATGPQGSGANSGGGSSQAGNRFSSAVQRSSIAGTAFACTQDPTFRILSVSGSSFPATFTPIDQYNLYTITGCSFGSQAPTTDQRPTDWVHVYGPGSFYGKFSVQFWGDNEIDVSLDSSINGFPDLDNLTLDVKRADGQETRKGGFKFYAARDTVTFVPPQSWVKLADLRSNDGTVMPVTYEQGCSWCSFSTDPSQTYNVPGPAAHVGRFYDGKKFNPTGQYDNYDFSHLAPGWTMADPSDAQHRPQLFTFDQNCQWVVTYRETFGTWSATWAGNNIRVGLSDMTCSGWNAGDMIDNYQNWTGSYYALEVWATGPRGTDPTASK